MRIVSNVERREMFVVGGGVNVTVAESEIIETSSARVFKLAASEGDSDAFYG